MIRIDRVMLAVEPLDMRCGVETAMGRVVKTYGKAEPHYAYIFLNKRANRMKVLIHDGFGVWLAARRLNSGKFSGPQSWHQDPMSLSQAQVEALTAGLPWRYAGQSIDQV